MMFERFTRSARQIVVQAQHEARRFGHNYIGPEHLLFGVVTNEDDPVSALLRDLGLTPERTEAEFIRMTGSKPAGPPGGNARLLAPADPAPGPLAGLDADALAAIGIDLAEVQARIEATFGPGALNRAVPRGERARSLRPRLLRRSRRRPGGTGPGNGSPPHHIPFTPRAKKVLELSLREALALGDNYIGMEHVALALLRVQDGVVPKLLANLKVSPDVVRAALLDQHRKAS